MELQSSSIIETALQRVGELLAFAGQRYAVVVIGGAALNLLGIVDRPTADVDVLAFRVGPDLQKPPEPIPSPLADAIAIVARDLALDDHWMNTGPALQWQQGLPNGLGGRLEWRHYGQHQPPISGSMLDWYLVSISSSSSCTPPLTTRRRGVCTTRI